jgi:hypothetical protein
MVSEAHPGVNDTDPHSFFTKDAVNRRDLLVQAVLCAIGQLESQS